MSPTPVTSTCFRLRLAQHLLHDMAEILEHDDGRGAGILQLVAQLIRGVERIGVDHHEAGAKRTEHRDGILQHIGQHQRDAVALHEPLALQPRGKRRRQPVHIAIRDRVIHQHVRLPVGVAYERIVDQRQSERNWLGSMSCGTPGGYDFSQMLLHVQRSSSGLQLRPDVLEHARLAQRIGMKAVGLHEAGIERDASSRNGTQRHLVLPRQARRTWLRNWWRTAVRNSAESGCRPAAALLAPADLIGGNHRGKIGLGILARASRAGRHWRPVRESPARACAVSRARARRAAAAAGGLAADAGVHHAVSVTLGFESFLQQGDPALVDLQSVGCAQAVAEDQQGSPAG